MKPPEKQDHVISDPDETALFFIQAKRQLVEEQLAKDPEAGILKQAIELMKKHEALITEHTTEEDRETQDRVREITQVIGNKADGLVERYIKNKIGIEILWEEMMKKEHEKMLKKQDQKNRA